MHVCVLLDAVIVSTSRYWLNYRHTANALAIYATVKRLGFHDSNILLMLPDDMACNGRSSYPGTIFHESSHALNLYSPDIEVDYRGHEVTADSFLRLLTGRVQCSLQAVYESHTQQDPSLTLVWCYQQQE